MEEERLHFVSRRPRSSTDHGGFDSFLDDFFFGISFNNLLVRRGDVFSGSAGFLSFTFTPIRLSFRSSLSSSIPTSRARSRTLIFAIPFPPLQKNPFPKDIGDPSSPKTRAPLFFFCAIFKQSSIRTEIKTSSSVGLLPVYDHHSLWTLGQPNHFLFLSPLSASDTHTDRNMTFSTHAFFPSIYAVRTGSVFLPS